ncbi:hypothetical protein [Chitinophaga flava]|uniref:Uncharacterized protein n=1 Tax=Chitinophaga flava TaxID=2259036 RepID=A0A365Y0B4_9BACT|nr:hypothetical protein [Chitinophaga flava]RBL91950.1 hypothetical protein DF182_04945 [Chitinophaga flava]
MASKAILSSRGFKIAEYFIPPFVLNEGEIVILKPFNRPDWYELEMSLVDTLTGKVPEENVVITVPLTFVPRFSVSWFRRRFYPVTVREYLKKNADLSSQYADRIYEDSYITPRTDINTLAGNPWKLLTIYAALSRFDHILFDLAGVDPMGGKEVFGIVKEHVKKGGAAILLDHWAEFRGDCDRLVEIERFT